MTVKELIQKLGEFDGDREVRLVIANIHPYISIDSLKPDGTCELKTERGSYIEFDLRDNNILEIEGEW